jgi:hypothetical protein
VGKTSGRGGRNYSRDERKCRAEVALKVMKGLTRTVGCEVGRPSSVPSGVWGGGTNREIGRGLITRRVSGVGGMGGEGHSETGAGCTEDNGERWVH